MAEKPRVKGHSLAWMAITRAKCQCGKLFEIPHDEAKDRAAKTICDWLMDDHADHIREVQ